MSRFGKRLYLHTIRTLTAPFLVPGLLAAWMASGRLSNAAVAERLRAISSASTGTTGPSGTTSAAPRGLKLAVVSDTHTENDFAPDLHAAIAKMQPDGILHLGDYSNDGGLFEALRHLTNWDLLHQTTHAGMLHVLGNHDKRTLGTRWFRWFFGAPSQVLDLGTWRLILLDNTAKKDVFSAADLALVQSLAATPKPSILCCHKPPTFDRWPTHCAPDRVPELYAAAQAAGVQLVLSGHIHLYDETAIGGIRTVITGGGTPASQDWPFGTLGRHVLELDLPSQPGQLPTLTRIPLDTP